MLCCEEALSARYPPRIRALLGSQIFVGGDAPRPSQIREELKVDLQLPKDFQALANPRQRELHCKSPGRFAEL